jgi:hypothetical protein
MVACPTSQPAVSLATIASPAHELVRNFTFSVQRSCFLV